MKYTFNAYYGNEVKTVEISNPSGAGSVFYISIDKYHNGQICLMSTGWEVYFNNNQFTAADKDILLDILRDLNAI